MTTSHWIDGVRIGDMLEVFDNEEWRGRDDGDNSQFWHPATILETSSHHWRDRVATVRFHHDGRISRGHFLWAMRALR